MVEPTNTLSYSTEKDAAAGRRLASVQANGQHAAVSSAKFLMGEATEPSGCLEGAAGPDAVERSMQPPPRAQLMAARPQPALLVAKLPSTKSMQ
eukprot:6429670-Lingulodinium_polyedra.AAC.1